MTSQSENNFKNPIIISKRQSDLYFISAEHILIELRTKLMNQIINVLCLYKWFRFNYWKITIMSRQSVYINDIGLNSEKLK